MYRPLRALLNRFVDRVPTSRLRTLLVHAAKRRAFSLPPADGLRFLFELDAALYPTQGQLAVAYGDGTHTKHRHTGYHHFFVARIHSAERVLDIGCGIGAVAHAVAQDAGASVVGIDLSAHNIAQASARYAHPMIEYRIGDVLQEIPAGKFDVVILSNVLEHLSERSTLLRRISDAIRPSRFLIRVPLFERDWRVPLKQELGVEWRLDHTHFIEYTLETFADEIGAADLTLSFQQVRWGEIWAEAVPT